MTNKEKEKIKEAIHNIMDADFSKGISQLCRLVGMVYPAGELKMDEIIYCKEEGCHLVLHDRAAIVGYCWDHFKKHSVGDRESKLALWLILFYADITYA